MVLTPKVCQGQGARDATVEEMGEMAALEVEVATMLAVEVVQLVLDPFLHSPSLPTINQEMVMLQFPFLLATAGILLI